jgi:hypothetical protein
MLFTYQSQSPRAQPIFARFARWTDMSGLIKEAV